MATNIKKDPAVIEHVNNEVGKASVKATKNETARVLKIVAGAKAAAKDITDKNIRGQVVVILNALVGEIKNQGQEATGGA